MNNTIFTTGAYLKPQKVTDAIGNEKWVWVVAEIIDDSFKVGEVFNPPEIANTHNELYRNLIHDIEEINNG